MPSAAKLLSDSARKLKIIKQEDTQITKKKEKSRNRRRRERRNKIRENFAQLASSMETKKSPDLVKEMFIPNRAASNHQTATMPQLESDPDDVIFIPPPEVLCIEIVDDDDVEDVAKSISKAKQPFIKSESNQEPMDEVIEISDDEKRTGNTLPKVDDLQVRKPLETRRTQTPCVLPQKQQKKNVPAKGKEKIAPSAPSAPKTLPKSAPVRMSIVNLLHPHGLIHHCMQEAVYRAVIEHLLNTLLFSDVAIAPKFNTYEWKNGVLNICCQDNLSADFLVQNIREVPPISPDCVLAAVQYEFFRSMRQINLYTNLSMPNSTQFLKIIQLQNPDLNVRHWLPFKKCELPNDCMIYSIYVDASSLLQLARNNGYVYYGLSRLIFHLNPKHDFA